MASKPDTVGRRGRFLWTKVFQAVEKVWMPRQDAKPEASTRKVKIGTDLYYHYEIDPLGKELETQDQRELESVSVTK
jgi:hypothetical protein